MVSQVALFVSSLTPGGAQRVFVWLANEFAERGIDVDLLVVNDRGALLPQVDDGVNVVNFDVPAARYTPLKLYNYLHEREPDTLLSTLSYINMIAGFVRSFSSFSTKFVFREATTPSIERKANFSKKVIDWLIPCVYPRADGIVCVSEGVRDDLNQYYGLPEQKLSVCHNPTDIEAVLNQADESIHDLAWFDDDEFVVLSAGRLEYAKGFDLLIESFREVEGSEECKLVILGEGAQRDELESMVQQYGLGESVKLPGHRDNPYKYMKQADLFVLPSRYEGCPNTLIEAMACGTQVVATDCRSGPAEILESGKWGTLVPPDDVPALSNAMQSGVETIYDFDVRTRAKDFSVEIVADCYLDILGELPG